jgi:hypothetical protein
MYVTGKQRHVENIPGGKERNKRRMMEGMNSTMIY